MASEIYAKPNPAEQGEPPWLSLEEYLVDDFKKEMQMFTIEMCAEVMASFICMTNDELREFRDNLTSAHRFSDMRRTLWAKMAEKMYRVDLMDSR